MKLSILIAMLVVFLSGCSGAGSPPFSMPKTPVQKKQAEQKDEDKKDVQPPKKIIFRRVIIEETVEIVNEEDKGFLQHVDRKEGMKSWEQ